MLSGNLESFGLIDVLGVIKKDRKNCILIVEPVEPPYVVAYFKEGDPLFIRFISKSFMVYLDIDFESILRREDINRENICNVLIERIPAFMSLKKGRFSITSGFIKYPPDVSACVETEKLIISLSRNLSKDEVVRKITDDKLVFEKEKSTEEIIEKFNLNDFEKFVLMFIDGKNCVSDIEAKAVLEEALKVENLSKEVVDSIKLKVRKSLYGFLTAGLISQKLKLKKNENIFDRIVSLIDIRYQKKSEV